MGSPHAALFVFHMLDINDAGGSGSVWSTWRGVDPWAWAGRAG